MTLKVTRVSPAARSPAVEVAEREEKWLEWGQVGSSVGQRGPRAGCGRPLGQFLLQRLVEVVFVSCDSRHPPTLLGQGPRVWETLPTRRSGAGTHGRGRGHRSPQSAARERDGEDGGLFRCGTIFL